MDAYKYPILAHKKKHLPLLQNQFISLCCTKWI